MASTVQQQVTELSREQCEDLLSRNHIGRMAYSFKDQVDIRPLSYVYTDGWIFGRTSGEEKLRTLQHNRWVAFLVDDVQDAFNWESVLVRGAVHFLDEARKPEDRKLQARASEVLRSLTPEGFRGTDPAPYRAVLFGLAPQELTGRRSTLVPVGAP
jgi:uncharacterized protein